HLWALKLRHAGAERRDLEHILIRAEGRHGEPGCHGRQHHGSHPGKPVAALSCGGGFVFLQRLMTEYGFRVFPELKSETNVFGALRTLEIMLFERFPFRRPKFSQQILFSRLRFDDDFVIHIETPFVRRSPDPLPQTVSANTRETAPSPGASTHADTRAPRGR